jgi:16S rRNA (cytosine967-C5)-methyltransferase
LAKDKLPPGLKLRQLAAVRLRDVFSGSSFAPFTAAEIADSRDRALANRLVTTALRRHGHLRLVVARLLDKGLPRKSGSFEAILHLSLAQLLYLPEMGDHSALFLGVEALKRDPQARHLTGLLNAVLRRAQAEAAELREAPLRLLFPDKLREGWAARYGADAVEAFGKALLEGAPLDLTLKHDNPALIELLGARPVAGDTVRIDTRDRPLDQLPGYADGRWWVQDAAAALPARLLRLPKGSRVLDLCAAPGGKTAQLVKSGYDVTALDNDPQRLERLRGNLQRLGYAARVVEADGLLYRPETPFSGILLDAPCSATGTFRRHPEVVWHRSAGDIAGRVTLQRRFIANAAASLEPGGTLVYCVCSLEEGEGEAQARWIAEAHPELVPDPVTPEELEGFAAAVTANGAVRTHPALPVPGGSDGAVDGFFIARFRRR